MTNLDNLDRLDKAVSAIGDAAAKLLIKYNGALWIIRISMVLNVILIGIIIWLAND